jgi:UDP-N-acetylglucosamine 4-epimerase
LKLNGKTVLVTGGAGFIGSHLCEKLIEEGAEVRILDNFSTGKASNLKGVKDRVEITNGSVEDLKVVLKVSTGCDLIVHEAFPYGKSGMGLKEQYVGAGVLGTFNVLKAAVTCGVKKVVNASSVAVYGIHEGGKVKETQNPDPFLHYGVTKLAGELYCKTFSKIYGLNTTSLRYFYVYGPRYATFDHSAMVNFLHRAIEGKPLLVYGEGSQIRDYTYIDDIVAGTLLALKKSKGAGNAYNLSSGQGISIIELAGKVSDVARQLTGNAVEVRSAESGEYTFSDEFCKVPVGVTTRTGDGWVDKRDYAGDISKATKDFGYEPKVGLQEGIERTARWLLGDGQ